MEADIILLYILLGIARLSSAAFGGAFSTGPTASNTFIREAKSTLIVPEGNVPFGGDLSLWVGMGTSNGDLIQTICERHRGHAGTPCEDIITRNQWCGYAYTLSGDNQIFGREVAIKAGDHFKYHYIYNDTSQKYMQHANLNGKRVSTLSTSSGLAGGFGTAVECAAEDCGTVPAHPMSNDFKEWINTVLTMDIPDPNYSDTMGYNNANISGFYSNDGGKTWRVESIWIYKTIFGK